MESMTEHSSRSASCFCTVLDIVRCVGLIFRWGRCVCGGLSFRARYGGRSLLGGHSACACLCEEVKPWGVEFVMGAIVSLGSRSTLQDAGYLPQVVSPCFVRPRPQPNVEYLVCVRVVFLISVSVSAYLSASKPWTP